MPIYPDKKDGELTGRYRVEVQLNGNRKRGRFNSLPEARTAERQWGFELASGITTTATVRSEHATPTTLRQLLRKAAPMIWNGSDHGNMSCVKVEWIVNVLGDVQLDKLDASYVDKVIEELREKGKSPATVNRYLSALRSILDWGLKRKLIQEIPEFDWQRETAGRLRYLSVEEEQQTIAILRALGFDVVADFVIAAIETGCRRSELLSAQRDQLDGQWLRLWKTKNGDARSVPLSDRARTILEQRLPWKLTAAQLRYAWDRAKEQLGLSDDDEFVVHALRHTRATRLVKQGVNLAVVQKFMGHKDIKTTLRYAHVSDDTLLATVTGHHPTDNV